MSRAHSEHCECLTCCQRYYEQHKEASDTSIIRSFEAGRYAARHGRQRQSNPHLPETYAEKFQAWNLGFDEVLQALAVRTSTALKAEEGSK